MQRLRGARGDAAQFGLDLGPGWLDWVQIRRVGRQIEQTAGRLGRLRPHEWAEVLMAGAYSTDLRSRVLAAVEARRRRCIGRSVPHSTASPPETRRASSATQATAVPSDPRFALANPVCGFQALTSCTKA